MSLADSSYPLLNIFWTMFIFFLWVKRPVIRRGAGGDQAMRAPGNRNSQPSPRRRLSLRCLAGSACPAGSPQARRRREGDGSGNRYRWALEQPPVNVRVCLK